MDCKRLIVSFCIAAIISFIVFLTLNDFGIVWDEPIYFVNGDTYVSWLKNPVYAKIDNTFHVSTADMHPPFRKLVSGITHELLTSRFHILDNTRGYRISSLMFVFPFILIFSYIAIGQFGYVVGIFVPFMYTLLPHILFLTPLVTTDYAIAAMWFISVVTAMKGMKSIKWLTISAVSVGLSMLTKLHGFLLFIPIGVYWLWHFRDVLMIKRLNKKTIYAITRLGYLVVIASIVYVVGWPWLWTSPLTHLGEYFRLQLAHDSVPVYVLGHTYERVGWWYTPLMFLTTTPVFVLIFFLIGVIYAVRKGRIWDRLMLANALYPIVFFSLPWVYRYDWVRFFLAAFPFVCLLTGRGIAAIIDSLRPSMRVIGTSIIFAVWIATVYYSVIRIHPWESAYYNEVVGGISGASRLGFETEFWGNAYLGVLPWMNNNKKDMMCVTPTTHPFYYYQAMGQIESGVVFNAGRAACHFAVVLMRQGLFIQDPFIRNVVLTQHPVYTVSVDGVALVSVYNIKKL